MLVVVLGSALGSCLTPDENPYTLAQRVTVPIAYKRFWAMTEACSGTTRSFDQVEWYRMPGKSFMLNGVEVAGSARDNTIILSDTLAAFGAGVRHEMLHIISQQGHTRQLFLEQCASVVACASACVTDAGPWVAPSPFAPMRSDSITVSSTWTVLPMDPDSLTWVTVHIAAKNPTANAIVLTPRPGFAWAFIITPMTDGAPDVASSVLSVSDSSFLYFAPNQVKEWTFDLRVASVKSQYTIQPGNYQLIIGFGGRLKFASNVSVP